MSSNKHVLIAIPVLLTGGTEIQVKLMVRVLISAGFRVSVCCYYEYDPDMVREMEGAGAEVILMNLVRSDGLWHLIKRLRILVKEHRPHIVHVQYLAPGLVPIIAARLAGVPVVFSTVHIAGSVAYGWKAKMLLRTAAMLSTHFFCVSKGVEEFWFGDSMVFEPGEEIRGRRHHTIYNAVDVAAIEGAINIVSHSGLRSVMGIAGRPVLGTVGRIAHQKGHAVLLDAMVEVAREFPEVLLIIIGDGPLREEIEKKAHILGIGNHLCWLGARRQREVYKWYGVMDILVMPSLYEGFGLTAAEAMAAGLPVVGTRVDGLSEIIEEDLTGYKVPPGDSGSLARALIRLLSDAGLCRKMGESGRSRVKELFSMERFDRSITSVYRSFS